jgi:hypothetical protein
MKADDEIMNEEPEESIFDLASKSFNGIYFPPEGDTATVQGEIGGEAQAFYITVFRKEEKITIEITSDLDAAGFGVSDEAFENADFGQASNEGKTWSGICTKSGIYYIGVTGHSDKEGAPSAFNYTITVTKTF